MFGYVILKNYFQKYVKNKTYFVEGKKKETLLQFLFQKICFKN